MTPTILALDLSLTCTGVCRDGQCSRISTKLRGWPRLERIVSDITDAAVGCDVGVIEGYSFGSKGRSVFQIAELGGIVRWELLDRGLLIVDVPPSSLKRYATGRGNAGKDEMIAAAIRRFGFEGSSNDEADAYLLWHMALHAYGSPVVDVPKAQAEAVGKVEWPWAVLA